MCASQVNIGVHGLQTSNVIVVVIGIYVIIARCVPYMYVHVYVGHKCHKVDYGNVRDASYPERMH